MLGVAQSVRGGGGVSEAGSVGSLGPARQRHVCFSSSGDLPWHRSPALGTRHLEAGLRVPGRVRSSGPAELQPWVLPGGRTARAVPGERGVEPGRGQAAVPR